MATDASWTPEWSVPPGDVLREALDDLGMSQSELARRMDRPVKTVNEIVNAKAAITPETALQLELSTGISAGFWNGLETQYRLSLARETESAQLEQDVDWARAFPSRALVEQGLIPSGLRGPNLVRAVLRFFGVSNRSAWEQEWGAPLARFRTARAYSPVATAVAAWLRAGELQAHNIDLSEYDGDLLNSVLLSCRSLTRRRPFAVVIRDAVEQFARAGVALVVMPEFPGTRLSGAARWLTPRRALIQVSLRYKTADQVWFTIIHEGAHLLLHPRERDIIDEEGDGGAREVQADMFARSALVPDGAYQAFVERGNFTDDAIRAFAESIDAGPGIVVGRLQRDEYLSPSRLNSLKERLR